MLTNSEAFWLQFTTVVGTITAPIIAVLITMSRPKIGLHKKV